MRFAQISRYFLLFLELSFIGWAWEVLLELCCSQKFVNRGFITLPFCPIYGGSLLFAYFLLGTPSEGRGLLKKIKNSWARAPLYFGFAFLIPTAAEWLVGWFFNDFFGIRLWSYAGFPGNVQGYISLPISILWAVAVTLFMEWIFPNLKGLTFRISARVAKITAALFAIAVGIDVAFSFIKL